MFKWTFCFILVCSLDSSKPKLTIIIIIVMMLGCSAAREKKGKKASSTKKRLELSKASFVPFRFFFFCWIYYCCVSHSRLIFIFMSLFFLSVPYSCFFFHDAPLIFQLLLLLLVLLTLNRASALSSLISSSIFWLWHKNFPLLFNFEWRRKRHWRVVGSWSVKSEDMMGKKKKRE